MGNTNTEKLLEALISGETTDIIPRSRIETLLLALLNGETPDMVPQSRNEALLLALCEKGTGGGGSGGGGSSDEEWIGDGNTHIWITLQEGRTSPMLGVCPNGTVTVDWGDGTTPDTLTGTSTNTVQWTPTHNYAAPGDYVITLTVDGEMGLRGTGSSNPRDGSYILRHAPAADGRNLAYLNSVKKAELGHGVTRLGDYALAYCYSLASVSVPGSVSYVGFNALSYCYGLISAIIHDGITSIGGYMFSYCSSLVSIAIPGSVKSIVNNAFSDCYGVRRYDFTQHTAVPTLASTNVFGGSAPDCEFFVPVALVDEWKAATNWATYASQIVGV